MKRRPFLYFILSCLIMFLCLVKAGAQEIDYKGLPEWSWHKAGNTEYYLYTPKGMKPGEKYPVALFLHGCCGVDEHATLKNCVDAPVRMWHNFGLNTQRIPTYIIAPATKRGWAQHIPDIKKVMDSLIDRRNADAKRMYICGFSMGAEGTFTFINQYPNYFAAVMTLGMKFHGDSLKVKNLPMWISQGETDYYSRPVRRQVKAIRILNGAVSDTGGTWQTGVNPRYSNFKGLGHVVLWEAASRQDMVSWAYTQVNDGNQYPNVFFNSPEYAATVATGKLLKLDIAADDPDGKVARVDVYLNHVLINTLTKPPYVVDIKPAAGRNFIEAVAIDDKGKKRAATLVLNAPRPLNILTKMLPSATTGKYYTTSLQVVGYGAIHFKAAPNGLPEGIEVTPAGMIHGVPLEKGTHKIKLIATDSTSNAIVVLTLTVKPKIPGEVLLTGPVNKDGVKYKVSKMMKGETPNFNSKDTIPSPYKEEINFSNLDKYAGLTYIKTDINDTSKTDLAFLSFKVDENVVVYVAYETLDLKFHSTIPEWLKSFTKQPGQIVAQYRYFNVYAKKFPKGLIVLPGADARRNGIGTNYFVMVKKHE